MSHYLRRSFTVADASAVTSLNLDLLRDDGVVVYLNGTEVLRDNMPTGQITSGTYPTGGVWGAGEQAVVAHPVPASLLVDGNNVLAVSLHNESRSSSDLSFHAALPAEVSRSTPPPAEPPPPAPPPPTRHPPPPHRTPPPH